MARLAERSQLSASEYLVWERTQATKHEYFDGEVYAMARGSPRHNRLCNRVNAALENAVGRRGHVFTSDQRVRSLERRYVYPDASVVCGMPVIEDGDVLVNPSVLVEVLSSTTEQFDRGSKWDGYRLLPSLTDYVLVSQERAQIEHFARADDGRWIYTAAVSGEVVHLTDGTTLDGDAIFESVFELPGG